MFLGLLTQKHTEPGNELSFLNSPPAEHGLRAMDGWDGHCGLLSGAITEHNLLYSFFTNWIPNILHPQF
jgi:hypothetical protein